VVIHKLNQPCFDFLPRIGRARAALFACFDGEAGKPSSKRFTLNGDNGETNTDRFRDIDRQIL
jgi:hypothetical protein